MIARPAGIRSLLAAALALAPAAQAQESLSPFEAATIVFDQRTRIDALADFDGDAYADVIGWHWANDLYNTADLKAWRNDGAGGFEWLWTAGFGGIGSGDRTPAWTLEPGRFDGDAIDDVLFSVKNRVIVLRSVPGGGPVILEGWNEASDVIAAAVADFDGDGFDDFALAEANAIRLYLNDGAAGTGFTLAAVSRTGGDMRLAELNGDAIPDLFYDVNGVIHTLYVSRDGSMTPGPSLAHGIAPMNMPMLVAGDMDGDADVDVAVFSKDATYVLARRVGPATFVVEPERPGGPATRLADVDGDGDLDGICCSSGGGPYPVDNVEPSIFHVAINHGETAGFGVAMEIGGLGSQRVAGGADMDLDGDTDLVAGRCILFNRSGFAEDLQPQLIASMPPKPWVNDADGDGDPDVTVAFTNVRRNDGTGKYTPWQPLWPAPPAGHFYRGPGYFGDFDGDTDVDVILGHVAGSTFQGMRLLRNTGGGGYVDGGFALPAGVPFTNTVDPFWFGEYYLADDVDADGDVDLIVGNVSGLIANRVWLNGGAGTFTLGQTFLAPPPSVLADLDNDGIRDLVGTYGTVVTVCWGTGPGQFTGTSPGPATSLATLVDPRYDRLAVADLDGDQLPEILAANHANSPALSKLHAWRNLGGRSFAQQVIDVQYDGAFQHADLRRVFTMDADGDADIDVLLMNYDAGNGVVRVLQNDGAGTLTLVAKQATNLAALADADGDGDLDAIAERVARGAIHVAPGNGSRRQFGASKAGKGGMEPVIGASGPFRVGEQCTMRIKGALGGTLCALLVASEESAFKGWPAAGMTAYAFPPVAVVTFPLAGNPGAAGEGLAEFPIDVHPSFAGQTAYFQAYFADPNVAPPFTQTNGLELRFE